MRLYVVKYTYVSVTIICIIYNINARNSKVVSGIARTVLRHNTGLQTSAITVSCKQPLFDASQIAICNNILNMARAGGQRTV